MRPPRYERAHERRAREIRRRRAEVALRLAGGSTGIDVAKCMAVAPQTVARDRAELRKIWLDSGSEGIIQLIVDELATPL